MPRETQGVIAGGKGEPVRLQTITVPDPGPGEVVVRPAVPAGHVCADGPGTVSTVETPVSP